MDIKNERSGLLNIFDRDTLLHLRIPFSFFLMPVFFLGISQCEEIYLNAAIILFIALHVFIYPGSNSYNSYIDKDTGSIGGLEKPPPATRRLYYASIIFDITGLVLIALTGWINALLAAVYIIFSKAYSWHGIRLKKYAVSGWLCVAIFQGAYTFMLTNMVVQQQVSTTWFTPKNIECMIFASLIIGGSYPLTQVYQHDEDSTRGDRTISYRLGITGTFIFTMVFFTAGAVLLLHYLNTYDNAGQFAIFIITLLPVLSFFSYWFIKVLRDKKNANFANAMLMNKVSSLCMLLFFIIILILNHIPVVGF